MELDSSGSEILDERECLALLEQVSIGRVGLSSMHRRSFSIGGGTGSLF